MELRIYAEYLFLSRRSKTKSMNFRSVFLRTIFSFLFTTGLLAVQNISAQVKAKPGKTTIKTKGPAGKVKTTIKASTVKDTLSQGSMRIRIHTDSGDIVVKLYDRTPLHRDNFIKLVQQHFYDSLLFHRVIPEFMIQGGDPNSKHSSPGEMLGNGGGDMARIPAEFREGLIHKRGALAAARDNNPDKASSACQFYLVQGKKYSESELNMLEQRIGIKYTPVEREMYMKTGGTPFLDQNYTVFGETESGFEVIDKIAGAPRDSNNRPLGDIRMYMEIIK